MNDNPYQPWLAKIEDIREEVGGTVSEIPPGFQNVPGFIQVGFILGHLKAPEESINKDVTAGGK